MADTFLFNNVDFLSYFKQLINICDDDVTAIALRFFPKNDNTLRIAIGDVLKSAATAPWSHCSRLRGKTTIHQAVWHIFQSFLWNFNSSNNENEYANDSKLLEFHASLLYVYEKGLFVEDSVMELCSIWHDLSNSLNSSNVPNCEASSQLTSQISSLLLKNPVLGTSISKEIISLVDANAHLKDTGVVKQICKLFYKAVQTAVDDLPYIDTLSRKAQNERIFTVFYLLSSLHIFTSVVAISPEAVTELITSLISASNLVRPFANLVDDNKLQFASLCGELGSKQSPDAANSLCELLSKALLVKTWKDLEDNDNPLFSKTLRLFSGIVKSENPDDDNKVFGLYLASFAEKKTYIALFASCCKECLALSELSLLEDLLNMPPFCEMKAVWFLLLIPHCQTLSQTLTLRTLCFPDQNSQSFLLSSYHPNNPAHAIVRKFRDVLTFLLKVDVLRQSAKSLDEMSQEKIAMQLEKYVQTSLFTSSDLTLIEYFLDLGELHPDSIVGLIIQLDSVRLQSVRKSVRFRVSGERTDSPEPITDNHILSQVFSYYAYCALKNITDAVYGCSVHLSTLFKDEHKTSEIKKNDQENTGEYSSDSYLLSFNEEVTNQYRLHCLALLDYGRAYCRLIYPLSMRLEVLENAFSLLFITYDHVHERIQDVAEEEYEAEGDMDRDDQQHRFPFTFSIPGKDSSLASSSVFTHSTHGVGNTTEQTTLRNKGYPPEIKGCLANEFLFRDMLFTLNECTRELVTDNHRIANEGVVFCLSTGHSISLKMSDDLALSEHLNRDSVQLPAFKDRLYRLQRAISEALWRLSVVSGAVPIYGPLELNLTPHEYYRREFKKALVSDANRNRTSSNVSRISAGKRKGSEATLKGALKKTQLGNMCVLRSGMVEKLASSAYMLAVSWSAYRRDLDRCEQILASYPHRFGSSSEFAAEIQFQKGLNAFISDVLLMGPVAGTGGKRLQLAIPFESPTKMRRASIVSLSTITSVSPAGTPSSPSAPNISDSRISDLNQLVATSLTQMEIKDKLSRLFGSDAFEDYVGFFQRTMADYQVQSAIGRPSLMEQIFSREFFAAITSIDLAFCFSPNLETAAALLSSLPSFGLAPLQTLLTNYWKHCNLNPEINMTDLVSNSLKWFTSTKLVQPDWTPSGVLVTPLFNLNPDHVARSRSGIMSLSRLISMTKNALELADHDRAEAMLTQVVRLLQAEWVETAGRTVFLRTTASKDSGAARRLRYLATFWNRLEEMFKSLGELGLKNQQDRELTGPLDLLAYSSETIFSQILFSASNQTALWTSSNLNIEEIATKLNVDLLQTIAACSCATLPAEPHDPALELIDEVFNLAVADLLVFSNEDPVGKEMQRIFNFYYRNRPNTTQASSVAARLWMSCSEADGSFQQARPPTHRLNYNTVKMVYERSDRLFVLMAFLSDFIHLLDSNEEKMQPEVTVVKVQLRSLKSRITENFRPLLTYMSLATIPLLASLDPSFPSALDSILLLPATVKATLFASDLSTWYASTVLRALMAKPHDSLGFFDLLPDPISSIASVIEYRDIAIVHAVETFFSPTQTVTSDLDLAKVVQLIARISNSCLRLEMMRRHCLQFTLSGFDFLVLTCPAPKMSQSDSVGSQDEGLGDPSPGNPSQEIATEALIELDLADSMTSLMGQKEKNADLVTWLQDWQKRVDLWLRLAGLLKLDITTTTVEHIHNLITNEADYVADSLIAAGEFSTGLQILNVCGPSAFPVSLATRLMSAYLTSGPEEALASLEQQAQVVQQLDVLAANDPACCRQLLVSFLSSLVASSKSAASIAMLPTQICSLLEFCNSQKIRKLLEDDGEKGDVALVGQLDQMVKISRLIPDDLKESCGPLIHDPLLLLETLLMNVKVDLAAAVADTLMENPPGTPEELEKLETSIQNIVAVYAFKALELPNTTSGNEPAASISSVMHASSSTGNLAALVQPRKSLVQSIASTATSASPSSVQSSITSSFRMPVEAPEPQRWTHDKKTETCMACHRVRFSMFVRRHHCRRCGRIVCADCSRQRATVRGEDEARVCDDCYAQMLVMGEHSGQSSYTPSASLPSRQTVIATVANNTVSRTSVFQWQLSTDDKITNSNLRRNFAYESSPNLALCLSILSLCRNPTKAAHTMLQIVSYLSKYLKPTREIDAALVLSIMKQLLIRAKVKFTEHSSDIQVMSGLATMCDNYSKAIDFLDSLLQDNCQPIPTVSDLIGRESSQRILSQLLSAERYGAAIRLATLMRPDLAGNAWLRWGLALLRVGCFDSARQKFVKCLSKPSDRRLARPLSKPLQEIIATLEGGAKRYQSIVADLVANANIQDKVESMTIRDLLVEPQQLSAKGALLTEPLPKQIFDEAVFYLTTYGSDGAVVSFFQRHGYWSQATRFILETNCAPEVFVTCLLLPAASAGRLLNLEDQMLVCDPTLVRWEKYLAAATHHLILSNAHNLLHRIYVFAKDYIHAAYVCLRHFFPRGATSWTELGLNVDCLHQARGHLEAYIDRNGSHWGGVEPPTPKRPTWEETPMVRKFLPQPEVQRLSNAISLQFEVLEVMKARVRGMPNASFAASAASGGGVKTLFTDVDSDKMAVVTELLMSASLVDSFALAHRIVTDFRLDPRITYGNLGHELARTGNFDRLRQLLICLRDVLASNQSETHELTDDIICAAVRGIHDRPEFSREQDALIAMLNDDDNKIEACLLCAKLRSAYLIAIHNNREKDVRRISEAASRLNQPLVKQICDQWLEQFTKENVVTK